MKTDSIYRGPANPYGFTPGQKYTVTYQLEQSTGCILLQHESIRVNYPTRKDFDSDWQPVFVHNLVAKHRRR
jgi:hypothetical protein